jgi:NitT/TauT family transport system ATP-binding protein
MYTKAEPLLTLSNVSLKFGEKVVLRDINAQILDIINDDSSKHLGQVTTLLGRSGIGKTQLLKIIAGLQPPSTGQVLIGTDQKPVEAGTVGMVLQTYPLFKHRTLRGNLELVSKDKARIDEYINEFDLWDHKDKYTQQLSGGQRQRTAIVQQLLCSEHFTLLDEPFSGLDPVAIEKLCANIQKVANHDDTNTIFISSHILSPSMAVSDSVWMLGYEYPESYASDALPKCIPGATIRYTVDLAAEGLAWRPDIRKDPKFLELTEHIRDLFFTM